MMLVQAGQCEARWLGPRRSPGRATYKLIKEGGKACSCRRGSEAARWLGSGPGGGAKANIAPFMMNASELLAASALLVR